MNTKTILLSDDIVTSSPLSRIKYPRTRHLPWSEGIHSDDRVLDSLSSFEGKRVVVTEKMDGENTTMHRSYMHARSVDSGGHPSRNWVKQFWNRINADIPEGWRICGENLYAKHAIRYNDLPTYFMGFSIWDERNICLEWDETLEWFSLIGVTPVPVLYDGLYDEEVIRQLWDEKNRDRCEGYVVRVADTIEYGEFHSNVAKFVRGGHVQTNKHWMHGQPVEPNMMKL